MIAGENLRVFFCGEWYIFRLFLDRIVLAIVIVSLLTSCTECRPPSHQPSLAEFVPAVTSFLSTLSMTLGEIK